MNFNFKTKTECTTQISATDWQNSKAKKCMMKTTATSRWSPDHIPACC